MRDTTFKSSLILAFFIVLALAKVNGQSPEDAIYVHSKSDRPSLFFKKQEDYSLKKILNDFQATFSIFILYESGLIDEIEKRNFSLNKRKGVDENLKELLRGTKLTFSKISETTYVILRKYNDGFIYGKISGQDHQSLIGANICLNKRNKGTVTDLHGNYLLRLPPGKYPLKASYVGFQSLEKTITIEAGDSIQLDFDLLEHAALREVVIVGSQFPPTSLLEKTEPAEVIGASQLEQAGHSSVGQLLQYAVPSFHATSQTISDGTDHITPATLRGLGPDQVLVLINGKRRHSSALVNINGTIGRGSVATDLNTIPVSAIEKIEVLRDGAAVQYGSDAIAGVVNIVLKDRNYFTEINAQTGITQEGDGEHFQLNGSHGLPIGEKGGFLQFTLDFRKRGHLNRSGRYKGEIFGNSRDKNPNYIDAFFNQTGFENQRVMSVGQAASTDAGTFFNAQIPLSDKVKIYGFGGVNYRRGEAFGFYRFPYQKQKQSGLYPMGFAPKIISDIFDRSLTVGMESRQSEWQLDLSNTSGKNGFDFGVENSNNASMGMTSPTTVQAGGFQYFQNVTNLNMNRKLKGDLPIYIGFGAEFRLEKFEQKAGERASWIDGKRVTENGLPKEAGFQVFPGFRPDSEVNEYRHNMGIFSNLEISFTPRFLLNLASRYEYYSDFGSHLIWKVGSRFLVNENIAFRATYNTGFRAPSMPQIHFESRVIQFVSEGEAQAAINVEHFNSGSHALRQFGVQALESEKSRNASFGVAAQLLDNLSLTLDAFRIDICDRIVLTGHVSENDHPSFARILEPIGVSKAQFFINAISTRTTGLDWGIHHDLSIGKKGLHLSLAGNLTRTKLKTDEEGLPSIRTSEVLSGFENVLFNREEISRIEVGQPQSKVIARASFSSKKLQASISSTRFGSVKYIHPNDGNPQNWMFNENSGKHESRDQNFSAKWVTDCSLNYRFSTGISLTLGANNIFNIYPDRHLHSANISDGLFPYSRRVQQFGVAGAFWFSRLNLRF